MKTETKTSLLPVAGTVALAAVLWFFAFAVPVGNFWVKISISAALLAGLALALGFSRKDLGPADARAIALGLIYAAALYLIFYIGNMVSDLLFPFAGDNVGSIYAKGQGTPAWVICLLLFFVTGPSEEIFWRGFLQKRLSERLGGGAGFALATALYAGVHICSLNFMLVGAAAVAGLFWGFLYWRTGKLLPLIISHSVWSMVVFAVLPIR